MKQGFTYSDLASLPIWKRKYHLKKMIEEKSHGQRGSEEQIAEQERNRQELMERFKVKTNIKK